MKKYIFYWLYLCFILTHTNASEVLIIPPDRFSTSDELGAIRLIYPDKNLPPTQVSDTRLGDIRPHMLTSLSEALTWGPKGRTLSVSERVLLNQARGTFGVVRLVQSMWFRTLDSFPKVCPVSGCTPICHALANWTKQPPLLIDPHAECMDGCHLNAYYDPEHHKLVFPKFLYKGKIKYTASSFDVVAHEAGHACLTAMCPELLDSRPDHRALHESFGDLTALFASLDVASSPQQIVWLSKPHAATCIGGDLSDTCIRDPHDDHPITCEAHDLSKPLTKFMCDYMNHLWKTRASSTSAKEVLYQAQEDFLEAMLYSLDSDNILQSIIDYFRKHKVSIDGSYFSLLRASFISCGSTSIAA